MILRVTVTEKQPGIFIIAPAGPIDSSTYLEFETKVDAVIFPPAKVVVLNMEGVSYISSIGLSIIFKAKKVIEENNGVFIMTDLQPQVKRVFEVIKALPQLTVFESIDEADKYLARIQRGGL